MREFEVRREDSSLAQSVYNKTGRRPRKPRFDSDAKSDRVVSGDKIKFNADDRKIYGATGKISASYSSGY